MIQPLVCKKAIAQQRNLPSGVSVKAFLVDGEKRTACKTKECKIGEQIDWVLTSATHYFYQTGLEMGTTNGTVGGSNTVAPVFGNPIPTTLGTSPGLTNWWAVSGPVLVKIYTGFQCNPTNGGSIACGSGTPWLTSTNTCYAWGTNREQRSSPPGSWILDYDPNRFGAAGAAGGHWYTVVWDTSQPAYYYWGWSSLSCGLSSYTNLLCIQQ